MTSTSDDSRALSAQGTNVGAPDGAIRARQGEDDAAAVMTTGGGVEGTDAEYERAVNLVHLACSGEMPSDESEQWLLEYIERCPIERVDALHALQNRLEA